MRNLKLMKIYSQGISVNYAKICTNENFPLYSILQLECFVLCQPSMCNNHQINCYWSCRGAVNVSKPLWENSIVYIAMKPRWVYSSLIPRPLSLSSLVPRPSPKSRKKVWCSEQLFLSHGAGSNSIKNVIIAFPMHCMQRVWWYQAVPLVRLLPRSSICL